MLKYFYLQQLIEMHKTFISIKTSADNWEFVSKLMQG